MKRREASPHSVSSPWQASNSMNLMEQSTLTFVDKSELAEKEANARKIILPHEA